MRVRGKEAMLKPAQARLRRGWGEDVWRLGARSRGERRNQGRGRSCFGPGKARWTSGVRSHAWSWGSTGEDGKSLYTGIGEREGALGEGEVYKWQRIVVVKGQGALRGPNPGGAVNEWLEAVPSHNGQGSPHFHHPSPDHREIRQDHLLH